MGASHGGGLACCAEFLATAGYPTDALKHIVSEANKLQEGYWRKKTIRLGAVLAIETGHPRTSLALGRRGVRWPKGVEALAPRGLRRSLRALF